MYTYTLWNPFPHRRHGRSDSNQYTWVRPPCPYLALRNIIPTSYLRTNNFFYTPSTKNIPIWKYLSQFRTRTGCPSSNALFPEVSRHGSLSLNLVVPETALETSESLQQWKLGFVSWFTRAVRSVCCSYWSRCWASRFYKYVHGMFISPTLTVAIFDTLL